MKNKIEVVSITLKFALLGVVAFAYVACGEGKETYKAFWEYSKLSKDEFISLDKKCKDEGNKNACQKLIDNGLPSVSQCNDLTSIFIARIYESAEQYKQAFEYYKKGCGSKHRLEELRAFSCAKLGLLYYQGKGVRQDKVAAKKYFGKACDLGEESGCNNYRILNEQGIK